MLSDIIELLFPKPLKQVGNEIIATCFFCDKTLHFYFNVDSGLWNCKKCGEKGTYKQLMYRLGMKKVDLIEQARAFNEALYNNQPAMDLLDRKGFKGYYNKFLFGYDENKDRITIPYFIKGAVEQIRYRAIHTTQEPKYLSSSGSFGMIYNTDIELVSILHTTKRKCIICEGEFDAALTFLKLGDEYVVIGVSGANAFKKEWAKYFFKFTEVIIAFDNDEAGIKGALELLNLIPHARCLRFPSDVHSKFDMSDYWLSERELPEFDQMIMGEVTHLIPKRGFIRDYIEYCHDLTDAPDIFHLFGALSLLSTAVGRNAFMYSFGGHKLYCNLWIIFVAPSSIYHKSTAVGIAENIIQKIDITTYPSEFSREALQQALSESPHGVFIWKELSGILHAMNREYMAGTKDFLADIYDCFDLFKRKLREKEFVISNPYVNILSATNLGWLMESIKGKDITGGFSARFLYIVATTKDRFLVFPQPPNEDLFDKMVAQLRRIRLMNPITYQSKKLRLLYVDFAQASSRDILGSEHEELYAPFYSRLESYLWKFAMLYQLSLDDYSIELSEEAFNWASSVITLLKQKLKNIVEGAFSNNEGDKKILKVLQALKKKDGLTRGGIVKDTLLNIRDIQLALDALLEGKLIDCVHKEAQEDRYFVIN